MSGVLRFENGMKANPLRVVITSWTGANSANRLSKSPDFNLFKTFSIPYDEDEYFQSWNNSDPLIYQFDSSFDTTNDVVLKNYDTGSTVSTLAASALIDGTTFFTYQVEFDITAVSEGKYYLEFSGTDADTSTYTAISDPFFVQSDTPESFLITYYNNEAAFGIDYRTGVTFYLRVPGRFHKIADINENEPFVDSGGTRSRVSDITAEARVLETGGVRYKNGLPQWMIKKINIALSHDYCDIDGVEVSAENKLPHEYEGYKLWGSPSAVIHLKDSNLRNTHDGGERVTLTLTYTATARAASEANQWKEVVYGSGLFVAISIDGTNQVMTSPDGITWTPRSATEANTWNSITYGNGLYVAVSGNGTNQVMTSPDGITWTPRSASEANQWQSVTYGNGLFVAVSQNGTNRVMTSPDGITWTARAASENTIWLSVTYGNGLFVAVASTGTDQVMTSPDGITWTARAEAEPNTWRSVTYGNGLFVAVSAGGTNQVMTSPDGITWTARAEAEANSWRSVTYGGGIFIAVSIDGTNRVMTSPDGITWTARAASEANSWVDIAYGNGLFVAVSVDGTNRVMNITYLYE